MLRNSDLARRIDAAEKRIDWLDTHGTRGVEAIRIQITELANDIGQHSGLITALSGKLDTIAGRGWQRFLAYALAILPVYVLLFLAVTQAKTGG
jgi:hypothetical protein